jgi:hypothetical protein
MTSHEIKQAITRNKSVEAEHGKANGCRLKRKGIEEAITASGSPIQKPLHRLPQSRDSKTVSKQWSKASEQSQRHA